MSEGLIRGNTVFKMEIQDSFFSELVFGSSEQVEISQKFGVLRKVGRYMNFTNRTIHLEIFLLQDPYNRKWGIINREQKFRLFRDSTVRLIECF